MKQHGFTLVELIVIMMVIGILAVAALPRFASQSIFDSRGFYDETLSLLRYAQKTAVAQRRTVCATFTATQVTLRIGSTFGAACDVAGPSVVDVTSPSGTTPYQVTAHGSVQFTARPLVPLLFNPDGSTSAAAVLTLNGAPNITVVRETGYVY